MSSPGIAAVRRRTTVNPPSPESNTPMGASLTLVGSFPATTTD
jgi:hypothetical protein